ncbi:hypothetical protein HW556_16125 [Hymenobacter sp. P5252]|uniref:RNA polymerase sigma-70 region 2 domain-containing protein n=2 Tax=Hymenobacter terrestris TaxID=2748310 RepID=A0ABX2Q801_9BACT|nr:hypothetical protein [Hymenobacter terrestris]
MTSPIAQPSTVLSTETALTRRLLAQDRSAMEEFYKRYAAALYGVIFRIVKREEVAEDVLQEAMVTIWHSFGTQDAVRGRLFPWAMNLCRNLAVRALRAQSRPASAVNVHPPGSLTKAQGARLVLQDHARSYVQPLAQQLDNLANLAERVSQPAFQDGFQASVSARAEAAKSFLAHRDAPGRLTAPTK